MVLPKTVRFAQRERAVSMKRQIPTVSVVIASFNHDRYIGAAIESILTQPYQDFEIVITDDGSTDRTVAEIRRFDDPRISLVAFSRNQGACMALNASVARATGKYVANLSSDDMFVPARLATQVQYLNQHSDVGAVFGQPLYIDELGAPLADDMTFYGTKFQIQNRSSDEWLRLLFFEGNSLCHPTLMIRRKCYEDVGFYNPALAQLPDYDMWIRLLQRYQIHVLNEPMVMFRILANQQNASARRPEVLVRLQFEQSKVLENYSRMDEDLLRRVFPSIPPPSPLVRKPGLTARVARTLLNRLANNVRSGTDSDIDLTPVRPAAWHLAELALRADMPAYSIFALQTMYALLPRIRDNSAHAEFIASTGMQDPFGVLRRR